jgi:Zn-finger nucleic acid-binding protein
MQLVACQNCHTQYDVTCVVTDRFTCRCGEEVENKIPQSVDALVHRCGACGAQVGASAESCEFCGSDIVQELGPSSLICPECFARNAEESRFCTACGVGFHPEALVVPGHEVPCPDCTTLMPASQVAGVSLNECGSCRGLWVPGENFDALVSHAAEAQRDGQALTRPPRVAGANPSQQQVRYRKCPECDAFMQRRNYQKSSGVITDVCNTHGTWLDADELEQIAGFILSGGTTSQTLLDEEKDAATQAAALAGARMRTQQSFRLDHRDFDRGDKGLLGLLFDILT